MIKIQLFLWYLGLKSLVCPCRLDITNGGFATGGFKKQVKVVGKMHNPIVESSGLVLNGSENTLYTMNDGGNPPDIYRIDQNGNLLETIVNPNLSNYDWEEITMDDEGNLYVGDFGNNFNNRKDLKIYKISATSGLTDTINFSYPEQLEFPPIPKLRNFDCEAFVYFNDSLYLFTKNRGAKMVSMYQLPAKNGFYAAKLKQEFYCNGMITAASLNKEKKQLVLLSYGKIFFFSVQNQGNFQIQPKCCMRFSRSGQAEGITYKNSGTLLICNERGKIFEIRLKKKMD